MTVGNDRLLEIAKALEFAVPQLQTYQAWIDGVILSLPPDQANLALKAIIRVVKSW